MMFKLKSNEELNQSMIDDYNANIPEGEELPPLESFFGGPDMIPIVAIKAPVQFVMDMNKHLDLLPRSLHRVYVLFVLHALNVCEISGKIEQTLSDVPNAHNILFLIKHAFISTKLAQDAKGEEMGRKDFPGRF